MKNIPFLLLILAFTQSWGVLICYGTSKDQLFYDAVRAEATGDFQQAVETYTEIKEAHSAPLHANLANLFYKLNDYPLSVLHFRKALLLDPENREYKANLSLALDKCGISQDSRNQNILSFSPTLYKYSLISLSILFWAGIILLIWFTRFPIKNKSFLFWVASWLILLILMYGFYNQQRNTSSMLQREVIAYQPPKDTNKPSDRISLRVFAGNASSANTSIPAGSSLFLDLGKNKQPRAHTSPDGEKWFLMRSLSGLNKGWVKEEEFRPVID